MWPTVTEVLFIFEASIFQNWGEEEAISCVLKNANISAIVVKSEVINNHTLSCFFRRELEIGIGTYNLLLKYKNTFLSLNTPYTVSEKELAFTIAVENGPRATADSDSVNWNPRGQI